MKGAPSPHLEPGPFSEDPAQLHRDDVEPERLDSRRVSLVQAPQLGGHARLAFMGGSSRARPAAGVARGLLPGRGCLGGAGGPARTLQALRRAGQRSQPLRCQCWPSTGMPGAGSCLLLLLAGLAIQIHDTFGLFIADFLLHSGFFRVWATQQWLIHPTEPVHLI